MGKYEKSNLKRYAEEQGLDPRKAGAVLFAATASLGEDLEVSEDELKTLGIEACDSKAQLIEKIRRAISSLNPEAAIGRKPSSEAEQFPGASAEELEEIEHEMEAHDDEFSAEGHLKAVLKWLGEK